MARQDRCSKELVTRGFVCRDGSAIALRDHLGLRDGEGHEDTASYVEREHHHRKQN